MRQGLAISGVVALAAALALSGCSVRGPSEPGGIPEPSTSTSAPSTPTNSEAEVVRVPARCVDAMSPEMYAATVADLTLNDPYYNQPETRPAVEPDPSWTGQASLDMTWVLWCMWGTSTEPNTPGLQTRFSQVDPERVREFLDAIDEATGFDCEDRDGGRWCQKVDNVQGHLVGNTYFLRDDVAIWIGQTDFPTSGFLADVVATVWAPD